MRLGSKRELLALEPLNAITEVSAPPGRRSSARRGRLSRHNAPCESTPFMGRKIPAYNLLDETALSRIEDQADWILSNIVKHFFEVVVRKIWRDAISKFSQVGTWIRRPTTKHKIVCEDGVDNFAFDAICD